jgi:hypothetical protein
MPVVRHRWRRRGHAFGLSRWRRLWPFRQRVRNTAGPHGHLAFVASPQAEAKDLRARRTMLNIPHETMAIGAGLARLDILSIEAFAQTDGYESETADYYAYWLGRLERLTKEQLALQLAHAQEGRRFK